MLISGAGGSPFPYIIGLMKNDYRLVLTDISKSVKYMYPNEEVVIVPRAESEEFESAVKKLLIKRKVEYYIPLIDKEIPKVLAIADKIKRLKVISPNLKFVNLCLHKDRLMEALWQTNISRVKTCLGLDFGTEFGFPAMVKPIVSTGSRGVRKIVSADQLEAYFLLEGYRPKEVMIQEYLEGEEYSVSVAVNNMNRLIAVVPKRIIVKKGITQHAVTEKNAAIEDVCRKIVDAFNPGGPFNVQLKLTGSEVKIFEINPRFSTTSILTCEAGVNEFGLCVDYYDRHDVPAVESFKENLHLYRRWESCFYEG